MFHDADGRNQNTWTHDSARRPGSRCDERKWHAELVSATGWGAISAAFIPTAAFPTCWTLDRTQIDQVMSITNVKITEEHPKKIKIPFMSLAVMISTVGNVHPSSKYSNARDVGRANNPVAIQLVDLFRIVVEKPSWSKSNFLNDTENKRENKWLNN